MHFYCTFGLLTAQDPPDGPPGAQGGLRTGLLASKTADGRPRRPPDWPPGAQDGLPMGLLAPKTASARASCRLHDNFLDEASVMTSVLIRRLCFPVDFGIRDNCLDDFLDETSV